MNKSVLKSPALWGFLILTLLFLTLSNSNLVWAGPDSSPARQTVPTIHRIFIPLIEKNNPTGPDAANPADEKSSGHLSVFAREINSKSSGTVK